MCHSSVIDLMIEREVDARNRRLSGEKVDQVFASEISNVILAEINGCEPVVPRKGLHDAFNLFITNTTTL
jgi:hypothetical protein